MTSVKEREICALLLNPLVGAVSVSRTAAVQEVNGAPDFHADVEVLLRRILRRGSTIQGRCRRLDLGMVCSRRRGVVVLGFWRPCGVVVLGFRRARGLSWVRRGGGP